MNKLPKLIQFLIWRTGDGMALGCIVVALAIQFDVLGLRYLVEGEGRELAVFLLYFQTALTFGAVNMGVAVMSLAQPGQDE